MKRIAPLVALTIAACGGAGGRDQRAVIQNKGSDTLLNVAQAWAEAYAAVNPNIAVAVTGGGSGTGISAMINGTVDIANSSRKMRESEIEAARGNGVEPIEFIVGYDALAVYLHEDNPIDVLTLDQLKAIYGERGPVTKWSDLGVEVPGCGSDEIVLVSRQNNSGTYVYFKEAVLGDDGGVQTRVTRHARLEGCRRPGGEHPLRDRLQRARVRHGVCRHALHRRGGGRGLRCTDHRDGRRRKLSDRPARS